MSRLLSLIHIYKTPNRALAAHVQSAMKEAGDLLEEIDQLILNPAEVA